jgi:hypothetical protein
MIQISVLLKSAIYALLWYIKPRAEELALTGVAALRTSWRKSKE